VHHERAPVAVNEGPQGTVGDLPGGRLQGVVGAGGVGGVGTPPRLRGAQGVHQGGSHPDPLRAPVEAGDRARDVTALCLIAAPEGVKTLEDAVGERANVTVVTAGVDERLNEHAYIVPGLGDAGDRLYGIVD